MSIRWKPFPTEHAMGEFCAAVDVKLGLPRTHDESEVTRGPGCRRNKPVVTETHCACLRLEDGTFVAQVDEVVEAMHGEEADIDVGSGRKTITIDTSDAGEFDREKATVRPPRGGLTLKKLDAMEPT